MICSGSLWQIGHGSSSRRTSGTPLHPGAGATIVGAIELVSPANTDRPTHRDAFVATSGHLTGDVGPKATMATMPLWWRGALCLPVALEAAYEWTCGEPRLVAGVAALSEAFSTIDGAGERSFAMLCSRLKGEFLQLYAP